MAEQQPDAVAVFGDDGEKFGTWPETKKHVYDDGWLARFFDLLVQNQSWIQVITLAEAFDNMPPVGKIYLPDCSYREMTEWALAGRAAGRIRAVRHEMEHDPRWPRIARFVRGGFWRNFKVKYPEADEMYSPHDDGQPAAASGRRRRRSRRAGRAGPHRTLPRPVQLQLLARGVRRHLSAAPAQRRLSHLIAADNLLDRAAGRARDLGRSRRPTISISTPGRKSAWPTTS